ncbi:hypothetical protein [Rhodococcus jostii]|uniref:hypothetical protein n=1 Tax=Rhodococcus jostii TaxID=132919 RepID=UPI00362B6602
MSDPFLYPRTVQLAADLRTSAKGPGSLPWNRLTESQKVPWIVKAYNVLTREED